MPQAQMCSAGTISSLPLLRLFEKNALAAKSLASKKVARSAVWLQGFAFGCKVLRLVAASLSQFVPNLSPTGASVSGSEPCLVDHNAPRQLLAGRSQN
jgi:hypothetical protein